MFCCSLVSEDIRLAFAFIVLLRLAGVSHCFSTHSALGPFFTVWLPCLDPISSFVSAVTVCLHRFPLDFSALAPTFLSCGPPGVHPGVVICCALALLPSAWLVLVGSCLVACLAYASSLWVKSRLRTLSPRRFLKREFITRLTGNMPS